jgi:hypothetical protein
MLAANLFPMFATSVHDSFCLQFGHKCWCQCLRLPSPLYSHLLVIRIICHYCFAWRYINCWWAIEKPMWLQNHLSKPTSMRYKYYGVLVRQNAKTHLQPHSSIWVLGFLHLHPVRYVRSKTKKWNLEMEPNVLHRHHWPVLQPWHMSYTKYIPVLTHTRNFGISGAIKAQTQLKRSNQVLIQKCDQIYFSILQASSQLHGSLG